MSKKLWDVIIVGGGPAGITAALRLAREDLDVLVVEAAVYPGAENWSGAVYFAEKLADPAVLGPEELERAPYERRVVQRGFFSCNGLSLAGAEYRNPDTFRHCYTVLRPVYDRYLAERARELGVTLLNGTTVDGLVRQGGRVVGVHTDRGPLYGGIVFLAEGDASHLVSKEGFERDAVRAKRSGQPAFLQGVKEVIELDAATIEKRFGIGPGEAACHEVLLRNGAVDGRPLRLNMAGFIYTNRSSISIGLVIPLENLAPLGGDYNRLMEWYKGLPPIQRLIGGGESTSYGAKIIRGGGIKELPQLVDEGVAIGGAATGIGVDFPYPNFTGPACAMGLMFAEAVIEMRKRGEEPTRERLEARYVRPLRASNYYKDVEHLQNWPAFIEHSDALCGHQIDLLNGSLYVMTRPDLRFARKWWEAVRLVSETLKGRWLATLSDLGQGSAALGLGRSVLKHLPVAILLSIPNTLLAPLPFAWGRGRGRLAFSFFTKDEETGRLPWFKRWLAARYTPALANAADTLYANDGVPLGKKLDRCVAIVLRKLSLWEILGAVAGWIAFGVTRGAQRLSDATRKPTMQRIQSTFYTRWLDRWRALTDLSPDRFPIVKSHDAKLGEISYSGDAGSHIKVFFPPEKPGTLEDPSKSALWSVCPAAVYQINVDRTLHASVAVNYENCVKCETCWRIEPQHVDWTRFGKHRLVYEVYTSADRSLRQLLAERGPVVGPDITTDFWSVTLDDEWPPEVAGPATAELRAAITAARRALDLAEARGVELHEDVWHGPRVLEPGQVDWHGAALDYFAVLAESAAAACLADPIEGWMLAHELGLTHVEILQLRKDLEALTERLRTHASARRFFAAEADARQIRNHHLSGLRAFIDRVTEAGLVPAKYENPIDELREIEQDPPDRSAARETLREQLATVFDRQAVRRLEHGGRLQPAEIELLRAVTRAALGMSLPDGTPVEWERLERDDVLAELGRVDCSLAVLVAGHLSVVDGLAAAGAPLDLVKPLQNVSRFAAPALEAEADPGEKGWRGRLPFVFTGLAGSFLTRARGRIALFARKAKGVTLANTPAIGLTGAGIAELSLDDARPLWEGEWDEIQEGLLVAIRSRDVAALALGAASLLADRAIDHARSRIQFPDMFRDIDGRDAVGKFGAVRAHIAHIEAGRIALETLLRDVPWSDDETGLEALVGKVAVSDIFGPDLPSITYRAGQVIAGTAFSEDDIFAKVYRDSSIFPHFVRENARLNAFIGELLTAASDGALLERISPNLHAALELVARRPILDSEVSRLRAAGEQLRTAAVLALGRADKPTREVIQDICGELAVRLYVWARLLVRGHRRLEGALPAQRYVEAAQLWADALEERLIGIEEELEWTARRIRLGGYAFQLGAYPDEPIATNRLGFSYHRDIVAAERGYRSGDFLLKPLDPNEIRYVPEVAWGDEVIRSHHQEYLRDFRRRFVEREGEPLERLVERLHYIPRDDINWTRDQGYFRVVIPTEYGGQGRTKADYYNLCMVSKRLADVSHTLTIQANTSIGTTPMLLGLYQDVAAAERDLQQAFQATDVVDGFRATLQKLLATRQNPDVKGLESAFIALNKEVNAKLGRSRTLKKVVFGRFLSQLQKAGAAGMKRDLDGFFAGLDKAVAALEGWQERAAAEAEEIPRRRLAHEFFLRLISARMISAFALTEPSAGSDTARQRTEARLDRRRVHTDPDGVKYFYLDERNREGRRNIADMRRFEFDGARILYRYRDDADPAEVLSQEYTYEAGEERYRYLLIDGRRIDIHDMALIRGEEGQEHYEFYVLNGAKMWITNGHIAGVMAIYGRTPAGVTGFMVDSLTEGFLVGKDEEKMGQRGSPTNEITLTNVRIPRECMIGIEGRGQENALETLNVGRTGLLISSAAGMQEKVTDVRDFLSRIPRGSEGWARYRLGLALEEMFATEAMAHNLIGLFDDPTSDALRMESSIGKLFGTDATHRVSHYLEPVYGIEGQTQRFRIEKDRRDDRVLTIYEGTNEIQQFLLLKDLIDMIGPRLEQIESLELEASPSPYDEQLRTLAAMLGALQERVKLTRKSYKSAAWQRALLQPIFFRLSRMAMWVKMLDSALHRAHWVQRHLRADGDATRRTWTDAAARGFAARAEREFERLVRAFDRDLETLRSGGRTAELRLAETVFDQTDAAQSLHGAERVAALPRTPITRDLQIVVAVEPTSRLAPRPRLENGRLAEHLLAVAAGDRRALRRALEIKRRAPERVAVTLVCAGPRSAEEPLRAALAAGADRALLLDAGDDRYSEHAVAAAIAAVLRERGLRFDLLLAGSSNDSPSDGRLGLRLATEYDVTWVPGVRDLWIDGDQTVCSSDRFPETPVRTPLPAVAVVTAAEDEPEWDFTTAGFAEALRKPLELVPFPADAERSDEEYAAAGAAVAAAEEESGKLDPERAAELLVEVGELGDGAGGPSASPYDGSIDKLAPDAIDWQGVVFVAELEEDDLSRNARGPLAVARSVAARTSQTLQALVLSAPLDNKRRRLVAGRLRAHASFARIVFAEHPALASGAPKAFAEALHRLLGPNARARPDYLLSSPWLAEALSILAEELRQARLPAEELPGISRLEFRDQDGIAFVRPTHERRLRARLQRPARGDQMRIVWCESEVVGDGGDSPSVETEVVRVPLELDYDPQADAIAQALAAAKRELGVVTLENAEFIIDVGAGLGSVDNLETVVEPLRQTLLELGAPHVVIGATRKVTMDMSWLPDEHQIGQTGVRVNPRVLIALGVSGAPQHIDYVGDRAVIFAFNLDAQAPLMMLNQRREQPKVYPVVGNLLETVPKFMAALRGRGIENQPHK